MCKKLFLLSSFVLVLSIGSSIAHGDTGLVGYWKFDETSGTTATDFAGGDNDGTLAGEQLQWRPFDGKSGGALLYGGLATSYVEFPAAGMSAATGTIALWANLIQPPPLHDRFLFGHTTMPRWGSRIQIYLNDGNNMLDIGLGDNHNTNINILTLETETWYHIAATWDAGRYVVYVDGEEVATGVYTGLTTIGTVADIGNDGASDNRINGFGGSIDEVKLYNRKLNADEILAAMRTEAYPFASAPTPKDGSMHFATWVNLFWSPGDFAVSHDVYLGNNFDEVNEGLGDTFRANQTATFFVAGFPGFPYPDGLVPGTYYWRIDEVNNAEPESPWKGNIWSFIIPPRKAYDPTPADGARFVDHNISLSWTAGMDAKLHHVYFGDNFADVDAGTGDTYKGPAAASNYTPGTLANDTQYFWRIDEHDGTALHKGDVWSFTTIPEITITDPNLVGWWTFDECYGTTALDWSGHVNHGTLFDANWAVPGLLGDAALKPDGGYVAIQNLRYKSSDLKEVSVCTWIRTDSPDNQYIISFDRNEYYRLEINGDGGGPGQVGWDVMTSAGQVDYGSIARVDDGLWHHVTGVFDNGTMIIYIDGKPEPSTMGGPTYGSGNTRFGFICANSEATSFNSPLPGRVPVMGEIDDLRIYDKALTAEEIRLAMRGDVTLAWNPSPANGSTPYIRDVLPLSWSPGDKASGHDVYFGTDRNAVSDGDASDTTGVYRGRQSAASYTPPEGVEWGGGPYYWRIDENNTDGTISRGSVWTFTVADFLKIEDFENYNDFEPDRIFDTWTDGWGVATNGSEVGYAEPNFTLGEHHVETTTVHGGSQSMPYFFDNNFKYSEASLTLASARNWTEEGVAILSLWFYGDPANSAEPMYVSISNANGVTGTVYHDDPAAAQIGIWTEWTIDLQKFSDLGVNLTNVDKITIGFGDKANLRVGGSGKMYFDDICLKRPTE